MANQAHEHVTDADVAAVLDGTGALCPGCVRILVDQLREEARRQRETAEAAKRGWMKDVAEVERLRAELAEARQDGKRTARVVEYAGHDREEQRQRAETAEAELDAAREQVKRVRDLHTPKTIETADEDTGETTRITVCVECDGHRERLNDDADPILHPCATVRDLDRARRPR